MRFVLGTSGDYAARLEELVRVFLTARTIRDDPMLGVRDAGRLVAAMAASNPADPPHPDLETARAESWKALGADDENRYAMCSAAWHSIAMEVPHLQVNIIGVREAYRGTGLARLLLDEVHDMCRRSRFAEGVSLTTEQPQNVGFYRHMGYRVVGQASIANVLPVWSLFRPREG
jgi:GNAT superfamily N-acetyltransferase